MATDTFGSTMSTMAYFQASEAKDASNKTLKLQCKQTYDQSICHDVCVSDFETKLSGNFWGGHYTRTYVNECNAKVETDDIGNHMPYNTLFLIVVISVASLYLLYRSLNSDSY